MANIEHPAIEPIMEAVAERFGACGNLTAADVLTGLEDAGFVVVPAAQLRGAVSALEDAADCIRRAASWITDRERHDWLQRAEARARRQLGGQ